MLHVFLDKTVHLFKWLMRHDQFEDQIFALQDLTIVYSNLELTTWPPANQIARNVSPDCTLNRVEHTLPCSKKLRAHFAVRRRQDGSDIRAQEREGHAA